MNFLILGDGPEELTWAHAIAQSGTHRLISAYPGFSGFESVARPLDLDDALAGAQVEAAIVGGVPEIRAEALRRVAAAGLPAICLHPPGPDSEAYYQVAMSRSETGAVLIPDLPARLHPGVALVRQAIWGDEIGAFRGLRIEMGVDPTEGDLTRHAFARVVDVVRSLLGEIEAVTATGDPPGDAPDQSLVVQLRAARSRRAEVRITAGPIEPLRIFLTGETCSLTLTLPDDESATLVRRASDGGETARDLPPWDPYAAILGVLESAIAGQTAHPDLTDGTRAMELSEAVARSLRRGRTVDLYYEEISEIGTFKSVMTSIGCALLLAILIVLPIALAGPAIGIRWTIYIAYLIPPVLVVFIFMQLLRFAVRNPK